MGPGSDVFLCEIRGLTQDERLTDQQAPFSERLWRIAPVITAGTNTYFSLDRCFLGQWGEPMQTLEEI